MGDDMRNASCTGGARPASLSSRHAASAATLSSCNILRRAFALLRARLSTFGAASPLRGSMAWKQSLLPLFLAALATTCPAQEAAPPLRPPPAKEESQQQSVRPDGAPSSPSAPPASTKSPHSSPPATTSSATAGQTAPVAAAPDHEDDTIPDADPAAAAAAYAARVAAAQSRVDALPADIPDEALRARVAEQWRDALAGWQAAAQASEQYARRRQTMEGSVARLQAINGEIEAIRNKPAATDADANHSIADLEAEQRELDLNLPEWTKQLNARVARMDSQTQRLSESRQAAEAAQSRLAEKAAPIPADTPPELKAAIEEARAAHRRADHEIVSGSDYFRNIQEPLAQLDAAERDLLSRRIEAGKARRDQLSALIAERRRGEADSLRRESEAAAARFLGALPESFRSVAAENRDLSAILDKYLEREKERTAYIQSVSEYNQSLQTDYERIRAQLESGGGGQALGSYLWAKRRSLQRDAYQAGQNREKFAAAAVPGFTQANLDELRRRIPRLEQELTAFAANPEVLAMPERTRGELLDRARTLLDNHTKIASSLSESAQRQSAAVIDMDAANKELEQLSARYTSLVDRYVLHLPGSPPLWRISFADTFREAWKDLSSVDLWRSTGDALLRGLLRSPWLLLFLLVAIAPTAVLRTLSVWFKSANIGARTPVPASPKGFLWRLGRAFLRSYPAPMALFAAGAAIWSAAHPGGDTASVGEALLAGTLPWLLLNLWRSFCGGDAILELYCRMPRVLVDRLHRRLTSILYIGLPLWIVTWFVQNRTEPPVFQALGGIVSLALAVLAACFWWLRMRPAVFLRGGETRPSTLWRILHLTVMALCLFWLVMSLLGYNYGALLVIAKATSSGLIITAVAAAALYWDLRLVRARERQRARAILYYRFSEERRRQREERQREARAAAKTGNVPVDPVVVSPTEVEDKQAREDADLVLADRDKHDALASPAVAAAAVSIPPSVEKELDESLAGARRLVWWLSVAALAITLLVQWSDLFPMQEWLGGLTLFARGDTGLTLGSAVRALAGGALCWVVAVPLGAWANLSLFGWNPADRGTRVATSALIRYAAIGVGAIWMARELGMAWSDAQWLVAALSVGLGFGLQEIILNFVSGIILLFERPVRVGDMVTIGSAEGTISRINIRTTTIIDGDRRELIIPNKELVTGRVVNWTLSDTVTRVVIPVGVAYGSDLELVQRLLLRAARITDAVLDDPAPSVFFTAMGDNSLNFELRAYTGRLEDRTPVQHELRLTINRMFQRHGVSVPFPQLDVHMVPPEK